MTELGLMIGSSPILRIIASIPLLVWLWDESKDN